MALVRDVLGRSRAIPAGAASLRQGQASRSLGSEQTPVMFVHPLVMAALVCPALFTAELPALAQPPGLPQQPGLRGEVLLGKGWAVWGGLALEGSIAPSSWCCSSG